MVPTPTVECVTKSEMKAANISGDEAAAALNRERHAQAGGQSPAPAPAVQGSGGPTPDAQDPDSFSRYFDLGRFEDAPVGR